jgi:hypothetical protein
MVRVRLRDGLQTYSTGIAGRTIFFRDKVGSVTAVYELTDAEWEDARKQVDTRNGKPYFVKVEDSQKMAFILDSPSAVG